ncbi:hypothetical protein BDV35DRAFT_339970 [Aspergillus flavus]|uniref:Uncharacterized protein n=1 Tax=Aspergillus flavus TaxID=5059 RepID=A0A5N6H948_ASPFL|nr:hypothetical protein BDV35DRAFT_339970 [Aspergillus flavus]
MRVTGFFTLLSTFPFLSGSWPTMPQRRSRLLARADEPPTLNGLVRDFDKLSPTEIDTFTPHLTRRDLEKLHSCVVSEGACTGHLHDLAAHADEHGFLKSFKNSH